MPYYPICSLFDIFTHFMKNYLFPSTVIKMEFQIHYELQEKKNILPVRMVRNGYSVNSQLN